jgi:parallel beta-helix repeat protein
MVIQEAINLASENDTILIKNGTYSEQIWINTSITLVGENPGKTIINVSNNTAITINADNVTISNLTIINAQTALLMHSSNCTIFNVTFIGNDQGVMIHTQSNNNTLFKNNFINNKDHAIDTSNSTRWTTDTIGNYWDNYLGIDTDNDGIGEIRYHISENASDTFPLINPATIPPNADFSHLPLNPTTQTIISLTDRSTDKDGYITSWMWDFGDNTTSTIQHPTHQYEDDGSYTITLTVTDNLGITRMHSTSVAVENVGPTAFFTFSPEGPLDIQDVDFRDNSTDVDGYIVNRSWYINDSYYDQTTMFRFKFPDDGVYTVSLVVKDDDGKIDTFTEEITVFNVAPTAGFSLSTKNNTLTKNKPISFKDTSSDVDGTIISYQWDFGDGSSSTKQHPTHIYSANGRYKITLSIEDNDGKTDTFGKQIRIGDPETPHGFLSELSTFDIVIVLVIFSAVITVFIVSRKFSFS